MNKKDEEYLNLNALRLILYWGFKSKEYFNFIAIINIDKYR